MQWVLTVCHAEFGDDGEELVSSGGSEGEEESDGVGQQKGTGPSQKPAKFLEGEKGASFAKAFSKIIERKVKAPKLDVEQAPGDPVEPAAILAESKSVAKRKVVEQEAAATSKAAKKLRMEMRQRGHSKVAKKGKDPAADLKEKQLTRLATRGVVVLFNAVAKSQKQKHEAGGSKGSKAAKLSKASFLAQLKRAGDAATEGADDGGGGVLGLGSKQGRQAAGQAEPVGWKVLQQDFTGLPKGSSKMKEWDKEQSDSDGGPEKIEVASDDDGADDDGW